MEKIVIEFLGRKKHVTQRWVFKEFPVTIGRGYDNDVIVSDPYVAEKQLVVTGEGDTWQIENLDTFNDILLNNVVPKKLSFEIHSGDQVVIGETRLRIVSSTHHVAATKKLIREKEYLTDAQQIIIAWTSVVLALVCFSLIEFLDTSRDISWIKILARALPFVAIPIAWTTLWASIGRTLTLIPNVHKHLLISTIIAVAGRCSLILGEYVVYMLNSKFVGKIFFYLIAGLLAVVLLNTNLKLATTFSETQRIGIANAMVWGTVILFEFFMIAQRPEFQNRTNFNATIKPPYVKILPGTSVDEFFADTNTLFEKVDKMIEKEHK